MISLIIIIIVVVPTNTVGSIVIGVFRVRVLVQIRINPAADFGLRRRRPESGLDSVNFGPNLGGFLAYGSGRHVVQLAFLENQFREVESCRRASQIEDGGVVGSGGGDWCGVRAEPNPGPLVRFSNLGHPLAPLPHPYSSVRLFLIIIVVVILLSLLALL